MKVENVILILAILSIFSGCVNSPDEFIKVDDGVINKTGSVNNLEIDALDYKIYSSKGIRVLQINFKITNKGDTELERSPDKFVLVLDNGNQIDEMIPTQDLFKTITKVLKIEIKQIKDVYPGASVNIQRLFAVPTNFDMNSTKIWVLSGDKIESLQ